MIEPGFAFIRRHLPSGLSTCLAAARRCAACSCSGATGSDTTATLPPE